LCLRKVANSQSIIRFCLESEKAVTAKYLRFSIRRAVLSEP
jgi:hypothetical protein